MTEAQAVLHRLDRIIELLENMTIPTTFNLSAILRAHTNEDLVNMLRQECVRGFADLKKESAHEPNND